jgi:hypothetical protein
LRAEFPVEIDKDFGETRIAEMKLNGLSVKEDAGCARLKQRHIVTLQLARELVPMKQRPVTLELTFVSTSGKVCVTSMQVALQNSRSAGSPAQESIRSQS